MTIPDFVAGQILTAAELNELVDVANTAIFYGVATGGTSSSITVGGESYTLLAFTSDANLTVSTAGLFDVLLVGGGGGATYGGNAGGGGAGGVLEATVYLPAGTIAVDIGAGGTGYESAGQGFSTNVNAVISAVGGGWGGGDPSRNVEGGDGGSGGGSRASNFGGPGVAKGGSGQGKDGGAGNGTIGGGGGGFAEAGNTDGAGHGGDGLSLSTFTGGSVVTSVAGGGAAYNGTAGDGGGGASGGNGSANTGGGAGGSIGSNLSGGSGIAYIRFKV